MCWSSESLLPWSVSHGRSRESKTLLHTINVPHSSIRQTLDESIFRSHAKSRRCNNSSIKAWAGCTCRGLNLRGDVFDMLRGWISGPIESSFLRPQETDPFKTSNIAVTTQTKPLLRWTDRLKEGTELRGSAYTIQIFPCE